MRILVTGSCGCIGTNLCISFLKKGYDVVGLDNFITGDRENLTPLLSYPKFKFIEFDIVNSLFLINKKLSGVSEIYHLACPTGVENLIRLNEEMLLACAVGTKNVLDWTKKSKASVVFTSSSEVYGDPKESPQKETYFGSVNPMGIRSSYEEGKRFAESLALMYVRKYGVKVKIARLFNTYGSYMSKEDTRVVPQFLKQASKNKPLFVKGSGKQSRTFCHVDDLVCGLVLIMKRGRKGEVYNIGSNKQVAILDLAKLVIKLTGSKSLIKFVKRPNHDHESRLPDIRKIKKLGWRQEVMLSKGLLETLKFLKTR